MGKVLKLFITITLLGWLSKIFLGLLGMNIELTKLNELGEWWKIGIFIGLVLFLLLVSSKKKLLIRTKDGWRGNGEYGEVEYNVLIEFLKKYFYPLIVLFLLSIAVGLKIRKQNKNYSEINFIDQKMQECIDAGGEYMVMDYGFGENDAGLKELDYRAMCDVPEKRLWTIDLTNK